MKIHPFSAQLRPRWRWAPLTLRTIDAVLFPVAVVGLVCFLVFGLDDLKAWLS